MMFTRSCIFLLLLSGAWFTHAGKDGYLRQGPPLSLRLAEPLPPRPAVNERILALGKPVEAPAEEAVTAEAGDTTPAEEPVAVVSAPETIVVDTANSGDVADPTAESLPAELELIPPVNSEVEEARQMDGIMALFDLGRPSRGANPSAVIVAPPNFLPPQPAASGPPSRAVYRSP